ncbi:unnamed protein product [Cunninghamella blakesleeana]
MVKGVCLDGSNFLSWLLPLWSVPGFWAFGGGLRDLGGPKLALEQYILTGESSASISFQKLVYFIEELSPFTQDNFESLGLQYYKKHCCDPSINQIYVTVNGSNEKLYK